MNLLRKTWRRSFAVVLAGTTLILTSMHSPAQVATAETKTVEVRGVVRDATSGRVLPRTSVSIGEIYTTADVDGRFVFSGIAPGRQLLSTNRVGYRLAGIRKPAINQSPVYRDGIYVTIPSEIPFDVVVYMNPSPVVSGTVIDTTGQPVQGAGVSAYLFTYDENGDRTLIRGPGSYPASTDDRGEFVLETLAPGDYVIRVGGDFSIRTVVPTFYPAGLDLSGAETVVLRAGDDIRLRPIILEDIPLSTVSIRVVDEAGDELPVPVVSVRRRGEIGELAARGAAVPLLKLPSGSYDVEAGDRGIRVTTSSRSLANARVVQSTIEVREKDLTLPMTVRSSTKIVFRVLQEKAGSLTAVPGVPLRLVSRDFFSLQPFTGSTGGDGAFHLEGVPAGLYRVSLPLYGETGQNNAIDSRTLMAAAMNLCPGEIRQNDIAVPGNDLRISGSSTTISMILRESTTLIQGKTVGADGLRAADALVAVIPEDPKQVQGYAATRADQDGNFEFKCVMPGAYRLYAWTTLPGAAYRNQEFMSKYQGQGMAIRVDEGGRTTVQATVIDR